MSGDYRMRMQLAAQDAMSGDEFAASVLGIPLGTGCGRKRRTEEAMMGGLPTPAAGVLLCQADVMAWHSVDAIAPGDADAPGDVDG